MTVQPVPLPNQSPRKRPSKCSITRRRKRRPGCIEMLYSEHGSPTYGASKLWWVCSKGVDHIWIPCAADHRDTDSFGTFRNTVQATSSAAQKRWVCIPGKFSRRHEQWLQYHRRPGSASCSRWLSLAGPNQQQQPLPVVF